LQLVITDNGAVPVVAALLVDPPNTIQYGPPTRDLANGMSKNRTELNAVNELVENA